MKRITLYLGLSLAMTVSLPSFAEEVNEARSLNVDPMPANRELDEYIAGQPTDFAKLYLKELKGKNKVLFALEKGRIAQLWGNAPESMAAFELAIAQMRAFDDEATISARGAGRQALATAVNDNMLPYRGAGFERVMAHHYQAMNYLMLGDVEGAAVELRNANAAQDAELKRHENEVLEARSEASAKNVGGVTESGEAAKVFAAMDEAAGKVANSFQNAYSFVLSGVVYELQDMENDAYIDYKKALAIAPNDPYLIERVIVLGRRLSMDDDMTVWKERYLDAYKRLVPQPLALIPLPQPVNAAVSDEKPQGWQMPDVGAAFQQAFAYMQSLGNPAEPKKDEVVADVAKPAAAVPTIVTEPAYGDVVVLCEEGNVPQKDGILIPLPILVGSGLTAVAFPFYSSPWTAPHTFSVQGEEGIHPSSPLCDMGAIAVRALKERIPAIATRQAVRTIAKAALADSASRQFGDLGSIVASIYNVVSEQPDTRCWISLPRHAQWARMRVPAGQREIAVSYGGATLRQPLYVKAHSVAVMRVSVVGTRMTAQTIWEEKPTEANAQPENKGAV
jgi:hypothetical protein